MLHILFQYYPWGAAIWKKDRVTRPLVHGSLYGPVHGLPPGPPPHKRAIIKMTIRDLTYLLFCFDCFFVIVASLTVAMKGGPAYFEKDRKTPIALRHFVRLFNVIIKTIDTHLPRSDTRYTDWHLYIFTFAHVGAGFLYCSSLSVWNVFTLAFLRSLEWSILDKDIWEGKQMLAWCYFKILCPVNSDTFSVDVFFLHFCLSCEAKLFSLGSKNPDMTKV